MTDQVRMVKQVTRLCSLYFIFTVIIECVVSDTRPAHFSDSLSLWGSFAPSLHIGSRARRPNSLISSVGWSNLGGTVLRHSSTDRVSYSGWSHHDGSGFGRQIIKDDDPATYLQIESDFITKSGVFSGSGVLDQTNDGGDVFHSHHHRIKVKNFSNKNLKSKDKKRSRFISLFISSGLEDADPMKNLNFIGTHHESFSNLPTPALPTDDGERSIYIDWTFFDAKSSDPAIGDIFIAIQSSFSQPMESQSMPMVYRSMSSLPTPASDYAWDVPKYVKSNGERFFANVSNGQISPLSSDQLMKLKVQLNEAGDKDAVGSLLRGIEPVIRLKPGNEDGENKKMAVIQTIIPMDESTTMDINIHIISSPLSQDPTKRNTTFISRRGIHSCPPDLRSVDVDSNCLSQIRQFLFEFVGQDFDKTLRERELQFEKKMERVFFSSIILSNSSVGSGVRDTARFALSNLLGGYGFFHGRLKVRVPRSLETAVPDSNLPAWDITSSPLSLFSGTPSRSTFPRPFLWDEGFHLSVLRLWNQRLFWDVLKSWLDLQFDAKTNNYLNSASSRRTFGTSTIPGRTSPLLFGWIR